MAMTRCFTEGEPRVFEQEKATVVRHVILYDLRLPSACIIQVHLVSSVA